MPIGCYEPRYIDFDYDSFDPDYIRLTESYAIYNVETYLRDNYGIDLSFEEDKDRHVSFSAKQNSIELPKYYSERIQKYKKDSEEKKPWSSKRVEDNYSFKNIDLFLLPDGCTLSFEYLNFGSSGGCKTVARIIDKEGNVKDEFNSSSDNYDNSRDEKTPFENNGISSWLRDDSIIDKSRESLAEFGLGIRILDDDSSFVICDLKTGKPLKKVSEKRVYSDIETGNDRFSSGIQITFTTKEYGNLTVTLIDRNTHPKDVSNISFIFDNGEDIPYGFMVLSECYGKVWFRPARVLPSFIFKEQEDRNILNRTGVIEHDGKNFEDIRFDDVITPLLIGSVSDGWKDFMYITIDRKIYVMSEWNDDYGNDCKYEEFNITDNEDIYEAIKLHLRGILNKFYRDGFGQLSDKQKTQLLELWMIGVRNLINKYYNTDEHDRRLREAYLQYGSQCKEQVADYQAKIDAIQSATDKKQEQLRLKFKNRRMIPECENSTY